MTKLILYSSILLLLISGTVKKYRVQLNITSTTVYCGGAAPPEEMIKDLATPKPYTNQRFYLKKASENAPTAKIYKEVMTDSLGQIQLFLPAGTYILVDEQRKDYAYYNEVMTKFKQVHNYEGPVDSVCLKKWYRTPLLKIIVGGKSGKSKYSFNHEIGCSFHGKPCIPYNGPMPP